MSKDSFRYAAKALGNYEIGNEVPLSGKMIRQPRADGRKGYLDAYLEYKSNSISVM